MAKLLHETHKALLERKGSRWRAVLITPGEGSSGKYSPEMLETFGAIAFPKGSKNWFMHPNYPGEQRDPRNQWGYLATDPVFENGVGLTAEVEILPHWKDVVESLAEAGHANLSIYAMGDTDEFGNVTALLPDVTNSIDLVDYPGRPGSGLTEQMLESARAGYKKPAAASAEENKEHDMDEKILEALNALTESLKPVVDFVTEKKDAAEGARQAEADADAVAKGVSDGIAAYEEKVTAIDAVENLSPKQVESLKSAAKRGEDITEPLAEAKAIAEDFTTRLGERGNAQPGVITESRTTGAGLDLNVDGWSN